VTLRTHVAGRVALAWLATLGFAGGVDARPFAAGAQTPDLLYGARVERPDLVTTTPLTTQPLAPPAGTPLTLTAPHDPVHPVLRQWLVDSLPANPALRKRMLVVFRDSLRDVGAIPGPLVPLKAPGVGITVFPPTPPAQIDVIRHLRQPGLTADSMLLVNSFGASVLRPCYWLIQALAIEMNLSQVDSLAQIPAVQWITPEVAGEGPPACVSCATQSQDPADVHVARYALGSLAWSALDLPHPPIGLVDTGVYDQHALLCGGTLRSLGDCVNDCDCLGAVTADADATDGHGTGTAAILTGGAALGPRYVGMTRDPLDSYRVYYDAAAVDHPAIPYGFQRAIAVLDQQVVVQTQVDGDELDDVCTEAGDAFDAGLVVIAAKGDGRLGMPGVSHLALAIDGYDVQNGEMNTGLGRTWDQRVKPDLMAPTGTITASGPLNTPVGCGLNTDGLSQSSGATPYGAGAAALMLAWLENVAGAVPGSPGAIDPGQVYAALLASSEFQSGQTGLDPALGAGNVHLPQQTAVVQFAKMTITQAQTIEIPVHFGGTHTRKLDAAIWWPEYPYRQGGNVAVDHDAIRLDVLPAGSSSPVATGADPTSVFQRVHAEAAPGDYVVRITPGPLHVSPRPAYVAVVLHPS